MKFRRIALAATMVATMSAGAAWAQLSVTEPWVRGTVAAQKATGAFMNLRSDEAVTLVGASSPVAGVVELHEMRMEQDVARMRQVERIDLPAGKTVELRPGGYHLMLLDLKQPLEQGQTVPLTLQVRGSDGAEREVAVEATVRSLAGGHLHGHHDHGHHSHAHDGHASHEGGHHHDHGAGHHAH